MRPPDDEVLLRDMLAHARLAVAAVADKERRDLDSDFVLAAALERFIEVIGEAASKVSTATRARAPRIPWREIVGMRNRLVHGYSSVDHDIVWDVISLSCSPPRTAWPTACGRASTGSAPTSTGSSASRISWT